MSQFKNAQYACMMVSAAMFIITALFRVLICSPQCSATSHTCFVSSMPSSECLSLNTSGLCETVDGYALNHSKEMESRDNVTMMFLPGVHNLTMNLTIAEKFDFSMTGVQTNQTMSCILLHHGSLLIANVGNFKLSNLSIEGFSINMVSFKGVLDITIEQVIISSSALIIQCLQCNTIIISDILCEGSVLVVAWPEFDLNSQHLAYKKVQIMDTTFHLSRVGNGLSCCNIGSLVITNISVSSLPYASIAKPPEKSLVTFCSYYPWGMTMLEICDLISSNIEELHIFYSTFERTSGTGLCIQVPTNAFVYVKNCTIRYHMKGGAMLSYSDGTNGANVYLFHNNLSNNSNTLSGTSRSSALSVMTATIVDSPPHKIPNLYIIQTHFSGNRHLSGRPISTVSITSHIRASIKDNNFTDNYGSAITAYTTIVDDLVIMLSGTIVFRNNTSHRGGAIHLFKSRITLEKGVRLHFEDNFAKDVGGAIYVHSTQWLNSYYEIEAGNYGDCFYLLKDCRYNNVNYYTVTFVNNSAKNGGEHIFGASILSHCNVCPLYRSALSTYHVFELSQPDTLGFSPISSYPSRTCLCSNDSELYTPRYFCTNSSLILTSRAVYPGQEFNLEAVLVGAEFGTGTGSVYAQFLSQSSSRLRPQHQYSQRVDDYKKCTLLSYTVYSSNPREILVLTSTDETVLNYFNKDEIEKQAYNYFPDAWITIAPAVLLTTPVYINLTLLPCPQGFHLTGSPPGCKCVPPLIINDIFCNFTDGIGYVYRNDTVWVSMFKEESIVIQRRCPFDYCIAQLTGVDLRDPDTQCAMNHAGTLCGGCRKGFSLALGTNMCLSCKNNSYLGLLVFFVFAGILLVVFIKLLNITVSQGTINGLIFYANIVWAYQDVFFPKTVSSRWLNLMKSFAAWLNLDFGIKTCFVQNLTGYAKTWMQFAFPFYIWSIAGVMVLSARYSRRMTILLGNNCVQVLATLFLLSYAKLFRTIITVMVPAVLQVYPLNSEVPGDISVVWAFDGNLSYCGKLHGFLFVAALLVLTFLWLPFTALLLSFSILRKGSNFKYLRWVTTIVPLVETYFGPLKTAQYYWVGLLLLVRGTLLIILALTYTTIPSVSLLTLVITITFLLVLLTYTGRVYRSWILSSLECSFLVNLQVLGAGILFVDLELSDASKEIVMSISVGVAFIQFLGIICFHIYQQVNNISKKVPMLGKCCAFRCKNQQVSQEVDADKYKLMEDASLTGDNLIKRDVCNSYLQYLEDNAESADSL